MADDLVLYTNPMSRGRVARWMLEETGVPYRAEILDYEGAMKTPEYRAINPMGKVPAITHRGTVVTENAAICCYLADAFPEARLAPDHGSPARAPYYRWLFFTAGPVEQAMSMAALPGGAPADQARSLGFGTMEAVLDTLEGELTGRDFIAGDRFTAADLYLTGFLGFAMMFGGIEKRSAFETYVARHSDRPAAKRANAMDDALMPPREG